jgi:hypothetical protein
MIEKYIALNHKTIARIYRYDYCYMEINLWVLRNANGLRISCVWMILYALDDNIEYTTTSKQLTNTIM